MTIDPATGLAGDMFVASLLDAAARMEGRKDIQERVIGAMRYAGGLLGGVEIEALKITRGPAPGTRLAIRLGNNNHSLPAARLREILEAARRAVDFSPRQWELAERAFLVLCRAEARAHRILDGHEASRNESADDGSLEDVHLHEAQDIVVDLVGFVTALDLLEVDRGDVVCLAPVHYGGGTVNFSHGAFPVPAPAVEEVIEAYGIPVSAGPVERELLTPTGASILAALAPRYAPRDSFDARASASTARGVGLGTLELTVPPGRGNALFVYLEGR